VARSVYKLEEIDRRLRLLRPGDRVLDLGCRPGSWLQYAIRAVGPRGAVVGIDRDALSSAPAADTVRVMQGDIFATSDAELLGPLRAFDVVLSDMAPDTSGVRSLDQARSEGLFERALEIAELTLVKGGHFVGKLFQGPDWQRLLKRAREGFAEVRTIKPAGSRKESIEQYVVAMHRR